MNDITNYVLIALFRVHTATTTTEASRTIEDMLEQITSLSMNETNCDG